VIYHERLDAHAVALQAEQVATVEAAGNELLNAALERSLDAQADAFAKPTADSPRDERERFIRAKYESKQFASAVSSLSSVIDRQQMLQRQSAGRLCSSESTPSSAGSVQKQSSGDQRGMIEFVGVLQVALHEARELAGVNISGKSDPYVTLRLGEQTVSSQHVNNSVNPTWGETLLLSWDGASPLYVELFDHNAISADRSIGAFEVPLAQLQSLLASPAAAIDEWFDAKMSREWASNFGEHLVAGAEGVTRGFYRGITGVWKDPIKGAKEKGLEGFAKGVGKGVAGVFYRPIKGIGTMVKHTGLSVGVGKPRDDEEEELVPAGKVHLTLTLQRFT
jgi:stromal membrane-associated protein